MVIFFLQESVLINMSSQAGSFSRDSFTGPVVLQYFMILRRKKLYKDCTCFFP